MKYFTPDRIKNIIRVITIIIGLWTGKDTLDGVNLLQSQEGGIAAAAPEEVRTVSLNGGLFGLAVLLLTKSRKVSDTISQMLGNNTLTTATYCANLGSIHTQWQNTTNPEAKKNLKLAARAIVDNDMFPEVIKQVEK